MPRIRYQVAASLDGFIARPNGEADWIIMDSDIDFEALFAQSDTFLMGRGTYEASVGMGQPMPGKRTIVFSSTLRQSDHPDITIIAGPTPDAGTLTMRCANHLLPVPGGVRRARISTLSSVR